MKEKYPIAIFNGPIATTCGTFVLSDIALEKAKKLLLENDFISAIGHEATAEILSRILKQNIKLNRIQYHQKIGQKSSFLN